MVLKPNPTFPRLHHAFADTLCNFGLVQLVEELTRQENTLDLIVTNNPQLIPRVEVLPGLSDHDAVFCEVYIHPQIRKQVPRLIPLYSKADWQGLKFALIEVLEVRSSYILFHIGAENSVSSVMRVS